MADEKCMELQEVLIFAWHVEAKVFAKVVKCVPSSGNFRGLWGVIVDSGEEFANAMGSPRERASLYFAYLSEG